MGGSGGEGQVLQLSGQAAQWPYSHGYLVQPCAANQLHVYAGVEQQNHSGLSTQPGGESGNGGEAGGGGGWMGGARGRGMLNGQVGLAGGECGHGGNAGVDGARGGAGGSR